MNEEVLKLEPKAIWANFEKLNAVPRPSKKEEKVIHFIKEFGKSLGLPVQNDSVGNVVISKPATPGMENRATVCLQSHLDMVHQKNSDKEFDFLTQGIESEIDGEWVTAKGTTLGSDNGMGVAAALTVLESKDIEHGPIEALFTIDEETGMTGAFGLQAGFLQSDILMNMDSEDEGELYIGCAGGIDTQASIPLNYETPPSGYDSVELFVHKLKGGHSGMDIILNRGNANKLLARFIAENQKEFSLRVSEFDGGSLRNAIPREARATVALPAEKVAELKNKAEQFVEKIRDEFDSQDPHFSLNVDNCAKIEEVMDADSLSRFIHLMQAWPSGVIAMSPDVDGLVETSTNLSRAYIKNHALQLECLSRSSVDSAKNDLSNRLESLAFLAGGNATHSGNYPGWKPNPHSSILEIMKETYNELFGKTPEVKAVHAGLECGVIGDSHPNLDMISFGPTIENPHSPDERVHIGTVEKFWKFLVEALKRVPSK